MISDSATALDVDRLYALARDGFIHPRCHNRAGRLLRSALSVVNRGARSRPALSLSPILHTERAFSLHRPNAANNKESEKHHDHRDEQPDTPPFSLRSSLSSHEP